MRMKKVPLVFSLLLLSSIVLAQFSVPDANTIKNFEKTKTLFLLTDSMPNYDKAIRKYADRYWKSTPYEFIRPHQFEQYKNNPKMTFVLLTEAPFEVKKTSVKMLRLTFATGNRNKKDEKLIEFATIPLAYQANDESVSDQLPWSKLLTFIKFFQQYIEFLLSYPGISEMDVYDHYMSKMEEIQHKELWLHPDDCAPEINSYEKVKVLWLGEVKMFDYTELEDVIEKQYLDVVYLHKVGPYGKKKNGKICLKYFFTTDGEILYISEHIIDDKNPDGFLMRELTRIPQKK